MSRLSTAQAQGVLRSLGTSSSLTRAAPRCGISICRQHVRNYSERKDVGKGQSPQGPSFQGQLMESITSRIQRERQEREKFAQDREKVSGARNWAVTFSKFSLVYGHGDGGVETVWR
jgi:D-lactate dehydrogenase (cytochrome)